MEDNKKPTNNQDQSNQNKDLNKVINDAQKSVVGNEPNNNVNKTPNSKVRKMTSYQEQMLQETTKQKNNRRLVIIIVAIAVLILGGVGVALFFVLGNKTEPAAVACDIRVVSYQVASNSTLDNITPIGVVDEFHFTENTSQSIHYTKSVDAVISTTSDYVLAYDIDNVTNQTYTYFFNFKDMTNENCTIELTNSVNNEKFTFSMFTDSYELSTNKDVTFYIRISIDDKTIANDNNTYCLGCVSLTLTV